ncbi:MAG: hypothetical protein ACRYGA_02225 [Janthinobacterium lividum]
MNSNNLESSVSNEPNIRAGFSARYLPSLAPFIARNEIRYYLCGVCIEKAEIGGVYVIATDGHCMAVVHDAQGTIEGAQRVIIQAPAALVSAAKRAKPFGELPQKILLDGKRVRIAVDFSVNGAGEAYVQAGDSVIEGKFPDWRQIVPDFDLLKRGAFAGDVSVNGFYLARLAKVVGRNFAGVTLWQEDPKRAVVIQVNAVPEMFIAIMPMHGESDDLQRSRFMPFRPVPKQKARLAAV